MASKEQEEQPERHLEQRFRRHFIWGSLKLSVLFGRIFGNEHKALRRTARMGSGIRRETLPGISHSKALIYGVKVRIYRNASCKNEPGPVLIYLHGGGWVFCSARSYHPFTLSLCRDLGATVVSVDYRLAPEHAYPQGQDDCLTVARAILQADNIPDQLPEELKGIVDVNRVVLAGDSAGGHLSAAVALDMIREGDDRRLRAIIMINPVVQAIKQFESYVKHDDYMATGMGWFLPRYAGVVPSKRVRMLVDGYHHVDGETKKQLIKKYITKEDIEEVNNDDDKNLKDIPKEITQLATNVRAWPMLAEDAELAQMPITMVQVCQQDPLVDEGRAFADRMAQAGAFVRCVFVPRGQHTEAILGHHFHSKASRLARSQIVSFFKEVTLTANN